ncbi:MAG: hypothetical protein ACE5IJ_07120 [Thermoplasmata archaeon]
MKIARGSNNQRGSFDCVVIHPEHAGYKACHPILHGIEIKFPRNFSTGFTVWLDGLASKIYADYVKLTDTQNGLASRDNRHLICLLRKRDVPRSLSVEEITRRIENHWKFSGEIDLKSIRFSLVAYDASGNLHGPFKWYETNNRRDYRSQPSSP